MLRPGRHRLLNIIYITNTQKAVLKIQTHRIVVSGRFTRVFTIYTEHVTVLYTTFRIILEY